MTMSIYVNIIPLSYGQGLVVFSQIVAVRKSVLLVRIWVKVMVLNATFNNISVISWLLILLVDETGGLGENQ
jgi:hypothetical protein